MGGYLSTWLTAVTDWKSQWFSVLAVNCNYYGATQYQYLHRRKTGATPWDIKVNIHFEVSLTGFIIDTDRQSQHLFRIFLPLSTSKPLALMYSHFVSLNVFSTDVLLSILDKRTLY